MINIGYLLTSNDEVPKKYLLLGVETRFVEALSSMSVDKSSAFILGMFPRVVVACFSEVKLDNFDISVVSVVVKNKGILLFVDCFSEVKVENFDVG